MEGQTNKTSLKKKNRSPLQIVWRKLIHNRLALTGIIVIIIFIVIAISGPLIRPDNTPKANQQYLELARKPPGFSVSMLKIEQEQAKEVNFFQYWLFGKPPQYLQIPVYKTEKKGDRIFYEKYTGNKPNKGELIEVESSRVQIEKKTFLLGTDRYGRDLLSRLMAGTWISFTIGLISILISLFIGISLGSIAAYFGGKVDDFIMWLINVIWSVPTLLLVIAMTLALGKGVWQVFIAVGLTMWVEVARVVRGQVLGVKQKEFVEAGKAFGFKSLRIINKHILPNVMGPVIVISASNFAAAILIEAGLSFLGLGAQPPQATWGKMISEHKGYIISGDAYLAIYPGIAICILVLSFVLLGNGLRDAFDAKGVKNLSI